MNGLAMLNNKQIIESNPDITLYHLVSKLRHDLRTPSIWPKDMPKEYIGKINELDKLLVDFIEKNL
jgi:hypothetical protein